MEKNPFQDISELLRSHADLGLTADVYLQCLVEVCTGKVEEIRGLTRAREGVKESSDLSAYDNNYHQQTINTGPGNPSK